MRQEDPSDALFNLEVADFPNKIVREQAAAQ
jgi:hypothetical protein